MMQRVPPIAPKLALFALLFFGFAVPLPDTGAFAQGRDPNQPIKKRDKNGDGKLSPDEWHKSRKIFDKIDKDKDGFLSPEDFAKHWGVRIPKFGTERSTSGPAKKRQARRASDLYFIDAHSQMDEDISEERVIQLMDEGGIYATLLAKHKRRSWTSVLAFAKAYPKRIIPLIYTKLKDEEKRLEEIDEQHSSGEFKGVEEVLVWHGRKRNVAPKMVRDFEDWTTRRVIEMSLKAGWPVVLHIEFQYMPADERTRLMGDLIKTLKAHPNHPFVLIHMAQLEAPEVRNLVQSHGNVYFMISQTNPGSNALKKGNPWKFTEMFDAGKRLLPRWRQLFESHPERFIFALDSVFARNWENQHVRQMRLWRREFQTFPPNVAHAIAHGNAERLWKLKPK